MRVPTVWFEPFHWCGTNRGPQPSGRMRWSGGCGARWYGGVLQRGVSKHILLRGGRSSERGCQTGVNQLELDLGGTRER